MPESLSWQSHDSHTCAISVPLSRAIFRGEEERIKGKERERQARYSIIPFINIECNKSRPSCSFSLTRMKNFVRVDLSHVTAVTEEIRRAGLYITALD